MIELIYSNYTEALLSTLVRDLETLCDNKYHFLDPVRIVTPNYNMETWLRFKLAEETGVAINIEFNRLENFIGNIFEESCPGRVRMLDRETVAAAVQSVLLDEKLMQRPEMEPVKKYIFDESYSARSLDLMISDDRDRKYLTEDGIALRRFQLSSRLAYLFQEYIFSRPEMIDRWRGTKRFSAKGSILSSPPLTDSSYLSTAAWQETLFKEVFGDGGILAKYPPSDGIKWVALDDIVFDNDLFGYLNNTDLSPVHVFGLSYVAKLFQILFSRLGQSGTLRLYTLNPCAEFWEDVLTHREIFSRIEAGKLPRRGGPGPDHINKPSNIEDPYGLLNADNPALQFWGRPGREHMRMLGELTDCDFESAFINPLTKEDQSLLRRLQFDILVRHPEEDCSGLTEIMEKNDYSGDQSVNFIAAPSLRREIESVADEIWALVGRENSLRKTPIRFNDIAVIVNSTEKEKYLPQIEAVFSSMHDIPVTISDLEGASGSIMLEAMLLLLKLPFGRFTRADMLAFLCHPAVAGQFEKLTPADIGRITEKLGILYGADHTDHQNTYIDLDIYNWDQGVRRLVLGTMMTGENSGDDRIYTDSKGRWITAEFDEFEKSELARYALMVRSVLADSKHLRDKDENITDWATFFIAQARSYLHPCSNNDDYDLQRITASLNRLKDLDFGKKISGRTASEMAISIIGSLSSNRGQYLSEGVVVSSFLPMRAIPFQIVFLVGLGEGLFPAPSHRDSLDLRTSKRQPGDVDPAERDRYMFLEALLCTRERIYLSHIRRDEQTGDPLQPSAVLQELIYILETNYLGPGGCDDLTAKPPLRRYEQDKLGKSFNDEAVAEKKIKEIARSWQNHSFGKSNLPESQLILNSTEIKSELEKIKKRITTDQVNYLNELLKLPAPASLLHPVNAKPGFFTSPEEDRNSKTTILSISKLRRFLECPMQGWATAALGFIDDEDDQSDLEEEDFVMDRVLETIILRDSFILSAAQGISPAAIYGEKIERLALKGAIPVGVLGELIGERHLDILRGWNTALTDYFQLAAGDICKEGASVPLSRIRFGQDYGEAETETTYSPLEINLFPESGLKDNPPAKILLQGVTEGFTEDRSTSIILIPKKPPSGGSSGETVFRYMLRGIVEHFILNARTDMTGKERSILVCYAENPESAKIFSIKLKETDPEKARLWLNRLVSSIFCQTHAYLLPCEAIFKCYLKAKRSLIVEDWDIRDTIMEMIGNERESFSSLWGPVPQPRQYRPPLAEDIVDMVNERFVPFLEDIISLEGF